WVSAVVLGLVLLISAATVYSVARPIRRLVIATRRVAQGEVDVLVPRGGLREVDGLALAFNSMATQLAQARASVQAYQAQLEARVDERTRQLQHLAEHDPLTELPNRRQLLAHVEGVLRAARAHSARVALLFIDLDNFKTLNDSLGHDFGDTLLQAVSQRLIQAVGSGFCARWGGDEFTVVLDGIANPEEARRRAFEVVAAFDRPLTVGARDVAISVSVGTSVFPDHASEAEGLLRAADAALFRAKELGRRQAHLFDPQLLVNASSRFALEQALRRAVKCGEFELFYQPEVSLETLQTTVVEALLRWRQPDGTYIAPGEFLVIAEQTGLIDELSDWVLRSSIRAAARWHRGPWSKARIAVNLSSRQLLDQQLVQRVEQLLQEYKLPAECLEIELTENVMQTGLSTIAALRALRDLGVTIALDDFGTGYSSLTSLEQLPLSRVKIDRSLVASIDTSSRSASIARSIIGLCHSLGLEVTAEGIERPSQLAKLLADRGLHIQGYLLSKPLSADDLIGFIESAPARLQELVLTLPDTPFDPDSTGAYALRRYRAAVASRAASPT
ncbi:MAG: EAL domain-containing protein, partial [Steroidobacteraceae bacterium]